jgi:hypothetical protein
VNSHGSRKGTKLPLSMHISFLVSLISPHACHPSHLTHPTPTILYQPKGKSRNIDWSAQVVESRNMNRVETMNTSFMHQATVPSMFNAMSKCRIRRAQKQAPYKRANAKRSSNSLTGKIKNHEILFEEPLFVSINGGPARTCDFAWPGGADNLISVFEVIGELSDPFHC